jgi:hypothetical protein
MVARQDAAVSPSDPEFAARFEQMGRFFMGTSDVHQALARVTNKLEELGIPYAICGGMAVNAHGYQRTTTDVDLLLTPAGHARFKAAAVGLGWVDKFPGSRGVLDAVTRVPIRFLLAPGTPQAMECLAVSAFRTRAMSPSSWWVAGASCWRGSSS